MEWLIGIVVGETVVAACEKGLDRLAGLIVDGLVWLRIVK